MEQTAFSVVVSGAKPKRFDNFRDAEVSFCRKVAKSAEVSFLATVETNGQPVTVSLAHATEGKVDQTSSRIMSFKAPEVVEEDV